MKKLRKRERCEFPKCPNRRDVRVELARESGADASAGEFCQMHADQLLNGQIGAAQHVEVWKEDGTHDEMVDRETAITRLQIVKGIGRREARRELERGQR